MDLAARLPFDTTLPQYEQQARALLDALYAGHEDVVWCFKWQHPRFRDSSGEEVRSAADDNSLDLADAQLVIAREYAFDDWADLVAFTDAVQSDSDTARFERAADAVVSGDSATLRALLREQPALVHARSARRHHATLLHYSAANGVENQRQRTPPNAVEIATILLDAGADPNALADMYGEQCATLSMLVSSSHPAEAGVQGSLAETLLDYGAQLDVPGSRWESALLTALVFDFPDTARLLHARGAVLNLAAAAGLGLVAETRRLLAAAGDRDRSAALALAAQHGQVEVVRLLLEEGVEADRFIPEGGHAHSTALHQAALGGHAAVVRLLLDRGAGVGLRDRVYGGTARDWALHGGHPDVAALLEEVEKKS